MEGRLKFDTWEDANGQTRSKLSVVADRVVFLNTAQDQDGAPARQAEPAVSAARADEDVTKALQEQLDQAADTAKKSTKKAKSKQEAPLTVEAVSDQSEGTAATPAGAANFKDQPPFEDDLPF